MNKYIVRAFRRFNKQSDRNLDAFKEREAKLAFDRLRIIAWCIIVATPLFAIFDIRLLLEVGSSRSFWRLTSIHLFSFLTACLFLFLYRYHLRISQKQKWLVVYFYASYYLVVGVIGSINSLGLSENVDSYFVITMGVATIIPFHPILFGLLVSVIHVAFIISIYQAPLSHSAILIKLVNTSAAVGISIVIVTLYFQYRQKYFVKEQELIQGQINFRRLFEVNPYPLLMVGANGTDITLKSNQALDLLGSLEGELIHFMKRTEMKKFLKEVKNHGSVKDYVLVDITPTGHKRWFIINGEQIEFDMQPSILIGFSDISKIKEQEEDLLFHASRDSLTKTYNRRSGMIYLQALIKDEQTKSIVICFLDINNLKLVNDEHGHAEGDSYINSLCQIIERHRSSQDIFFRYGGDEFILAFPNHSLQAGEMKWMNIQKEITSESQLQLKPFSLSVSCGFSFFEGGMDVTLDELIHEADQKMYVNKRLTKPFSV